MPMIRFASAASALLIGFASSADRAAPRATNEIIPREPAAVKRAYGPAQKIGNGLVRTYVTMDAKHPRIPVEIGIVLTEAALENLPAAMPSHGAHDMASMHVYDLELPA